MTKPPRKKPTGSSATAFATPRAASRLQTPTTPGLYAPTTEAEQGLITAIGETGSFDARSLNVEERVVRPSFLRALLLGRMPGKAVPENGLRTSGLVFRERLRLAHLSNGGEPLPQLWLDYAELKAGAEFVDSRFNQLSLEYATIEEGLDVQRFQTVGGLWLDRLVCSGGLNLKGARIGGQLGLKGARLRGSADEEGRIIGWALSADHAALVGGVFCQPRGGQRFESQGEIRLVGAEVGGQVNLVGARLSGPVDAANHVVGNALAADGARFAGDIHCTPADGHRFEAHGEVRLLGADIRGMVCFSGAHLKGPVGPGGHVVGDAFSADGASIGGALFCDPSEDHRFEADGEVRLLNATIKGDLVLRGARLKGAADSAGRVVGDALSADRATIGGSVFADSVDGHHLEANGTVRFLGATIGSQLALGGARLKGPIDASGRVVGNAFSANQARVASDTFLDAGIEIDGAAVFIGATLNDLFLRGSFTGSTVGDKVVALDLRDTSTRRLHIRPQGIVGQGRVQLEGAKIDTIDKLDPNLWGPDLHEHTGLELDLDGLTYRRAEFSATPRTRTRRWAEFRFTHDPEAENVLDLLDRGFRGPKPCRKHYSPQPFEQAVKALREAGYRRAADEVAVAKREFHRECRADGWPAAIMSLISLVFFRYGYGPLRASIWTVGFVLLGAGGVWLGQHLDLLVTVPEAGQAVKRCAEVPLSLALDTFLPLVDFGVDKRCRVAPDLPWSSLAETLRVSYAILGWLFIPMVALTFAGVLRKD